MHKDHNKETDNSGDCTGEAELSSTQFRMHVGPTWFVQTLDFRRISMLNALFCPEQCVQLLTSGQNCTHSINACCAFYTG